MAALTSSRGSTKGQSWQTSNFMVKPYAIIGLAGLAFGGLGYYQSKYVDNHPQTEEEEEDAFVSAETLAKTIKWAGYIMIVVALYLSYVNRKEIAESARDIAGRTAAAIRSRT